MVDIDYSFKQAAGLKAFADTMLQFFSSHDINVRAGVVMPEEACPFLILMPHGDSTIEQMNDLLQSLKSTYQVKSAQNEQAARILFLLEAVRIHPESDHLPPSVVVSGGQQVLDDLCEELSLKAA